MHNKVVEIRIHLPTGEVVTKQPEDVLTWPPLNLRTPVIGIFDGDQQAQQVALPMAPVAIIFRDNEDRAIWRRWYGASLEIVERESPLVEVPKGSISLVA